jgi:hypothetical protein
LPDRYFGKEFYWFPKFDGQNFRAEWNKKRGWYKFGSRNDLVDSTNPYWKPVIELFMDTAGKNYNSILTGYNVTRCIAFFEYWGPNSFAGVHKEGDSMGFTLIDIKVDKKGFTRPGVYTSYLDKSDPVICNYTQELIETVNNYVWGEGQTEPIHRVCTFEGVVGKRMEGNQLIMVKVKTNAWKQRVRDRFGAVTAHAILES